MRLTTNTSGEAGCCNFCNDNIGPRGTRDRHATVYELHGLCVTVRLCTSCLHELARTLHRRRRDFTECQCQGDAGCKHHGD